MSLNSFHPLSRSAKPWKRLLLVLGCAMALSFSALPQSFATDLPSGVLNYLRHKDPQVKVRFDGVVVFSNGETYVPVLPQDPSLNPDSQQVVATFPEKAAFPDLIQFDNNFFLMRLIQTASGRLTFPKMAEYPIQLKEGMLPQDFVLPDNLFIPVELKVILGSLPYNPSNTAPEVTPHHVKDGPLGTSNNYQLKSTGRLTYVFDLTEQKLIGIDTVTGRKQGDVSLDCVPSSLKLSADGKLLFAPCLSTNELVVIDTGSNLVKTRVPVGQRPDAVLYLDDTHEVLVSNRFSPFLSLVNSEELTGGQKIDLPGNGGAMARVPGGKTPQVVVADAFKAQVYLVDMTTRAVVKNLKAVQDITALRAFRDDAGHVQVWATSRTEAQVVLIDAEKDTILKTVSVGAKPVDMADFGDKLYVVCAGASRVDVVERSSQSVVATIPLEADAFPAGIVTLADEKRAFVVTAAANNLVVLNLIGNQVENTFPVEFRANMIATVPDKLDFVPEPAPKITEPSPEANPKKPAKASEKTANKTEKQENKHTAAKSVVKPLKSKSRPVSSNSSSSGASAGVVGQPVTGGSSALYPNGPAKFRLNLGVGRPAKKMTPLDSAPSQAAKAGVRLPNPASAPEPQSGTKPAQPADQPNAMLMMAPDVQK